MSFEVVLVHEPETGGCRCTSEGCPFHEEVTGHEAVLDMQWHAVQHAVTEGHTVIEHAELHGLVRPRSGVSY